MSLSKRVRFDVFKRDGFVCQYCGRHPPDVVLECDHVDPRAAGGVDEEWNLVTACFDCNRGKSATPLSVVPKSLAEQAVEVQEREDQLMGYRAVLQIRLDRIEDDKWAVARKLLPSAERVERDWLRSIKTFNERLPLHEVFDAAEAALAKKPYSEYARFKYFCGICWSKIKEASPR
jgi:hypothetical protein